MSVSPDAARAQHLEDALRASEELLLATFELAPIGIAHVAPNGRWLRANRRLCEILGYDCEELLGMRFQDLTHPEDLAGDLDQALRTLAGEQSSYIIDKRYIRKDGSAIWAEVRSALVRDAAEKPLFFVAIVDDFSVQRLAEMARERHETELRTLVEGLPDIVTRFDREGRHLYVNPAVEHATGKPAAEFLGRTNRELGMPEHLVARWEQTLRDVVDNDRPGEIGFSFPTPGGERRYWTRLVPEHDAEGRVVGVLAVARDLARADELGVRVEQTLRLKLHGSVEEGSAAQPEGTQAVLSTIFDQAAVGMAEVGLDGRWLRVNQRLAAITGYTPDELLALTYVDLTDPADAAADVRPAARLLAGEIDTYTREKRYVRRDGERVWVNVTVSMVRDAAARPAYFIALVEDIHARKEAEALLRESEQRFRFLAEMIPHLVWSTRPDGYHDYFNERWFEYTGLTFEDTRGPKWNDVLHPDDRERAWNRWQQSLDTGEPYSIEYRFRRNDGAYRWFLGLALPLRGADGEIQRWFGTCTDIQAIKDTEAALRESEERLHAALGASETGTFRWDIRSGALDWDGALDRLFGLSAAESPRTVDAFLPLVHPDHRAQVVAAVGRCAEAGIDFNEEFRIVRPGGEIRWVLDKGRTYVDGGGRPLYLTGACVDITAHKEIELERERLLASAQEARARAEAASLAKSDFLAQMSHELRTPINAVLGYADLLDVGIPTPLGPIQAEYVRRIKRSSQHLLGLVNGVLDLAKVEARDMQILHEKVEMDAVIRDAVDLVESLLREKGFQFSAWTEPCGEADVYGDPDRIRQILINLLSNASKFTPAGGSISLRCRITDSAPDTLANGGASAWLAIDVEDSGQGIPPRMQERVFEPFVQVKDGNNPHGGGTGLGLPISRSFARLMGGDLVLRSVPGQGSCFTLWLPASHPDDGRAES